MGRWAALACATATPEVDGDIPQEIVEEVNSGIDEGAFQTTTLPRPALVLRIPSSRRRSRRKLENLEQPTIPPPKGNAPDLDDM